MAFQASLNDTFRRVWALQNSLNDTLRGLLGRTPYDVQITLDAQETTRFKQHPPSLRAQEKMEIRVYGRGHSTPRAVVLRSVLQNCRGVPFKGPGSLGGSRLKGPSKDRGVQGGRGEGGKVNLPPYRWLIHADGSANRPGRPRDETRFKQHPPNGNPTRR